VGGKPFQLEAAIQAREGRQQLMAEARFGFSKGQTGPDSREGIAAPLDVDGLRQATFGTVGRGLCLVSWC